MDKTDIHKCIDHIKLVSLTKDILLDDFVSEYKEYELFLKENALKYQEKNISFTHLLIHRVDNGIMAYMTLSTDAIQLTSDEKECSDMNEIPFSTIPALKIGKLCVDDNYRELYSGIGSLMIDFARGFAFTINENGVACRFLTIDADIEHNPSVVAFYEVNRFVANEKYRKRTVSISMRKDVFSM